MVSLWFTPACAPEKRPLGNQSGNQFGDVAKRLLFPGAGPLRQGRALRRRVAQPALRLGAGIGGLTRTRFIEPRRHVVGANPVPNLVHCGALLRTARTHGRETKAELNPEQGGVLATFPKRTISSSRWRARLRRERSAVALGLALPRKQVW